MSSETEPSPKILKVYSLAPSYTNNTGNNIIPESQMLATHTSNNGLGTRFILSNAAAPINTSTTSRPYYAPNQNNTVINIHPARSVHPIRIQPSANQNIRLVNQNIQLVNERLQQNRYIKPLVSVQPVTIQLSPQVNQDVNNVQNPVNHVSTLTTALQIPHLNNSIVAHSTLSSDTNIIDRTVVYSTVDIKTSVSQRNPFSNISIETMNQLATTLSDKQQYKQLEQDISTTKHRIVSSDNSLIVTPSMKVITPAMKPQKLNAWCESNHLAPSSCVTMKNSAIMAAKTIFQEKVPLQEIIQVVSNIHTNPSNNTLTRSRNPVLLPTSTENKPVCLYPLKPGSAIARPLNFSTVLPLPDSKKVSPINPSNLKLATASTASFGLNSIDSKNVTLNSFNNVGSLNVNTEKQSVKQQSAITCTVGVSSINKQSFVKQENRSPTTAPQTLHLSLNENDNKLSIANTTTQKKIVPKTEIAPQSALMSTPVLDNKIIQNKNINKTKPRSSRNLREKQEFKISADSITELKSKLLQATLPQQVEITGSVKPNEIKLKQKQSVKYEAHSNKLSKTKNEESLEQLEQNETNIEEDEAMEIAASLFIEPKEEQVEELTTTTEVLSSTTKGEERVEESPEIKSFNYIIFNEDVQQEDGTDTDEYSVSSSSEIDDDGAHENSDDSEYTPSDTGSDRSSDEPESKRKKLNNGKSSISYPVNSFIQAIITTASSVIQTTTTITSTNNNSNNKAEEHVSLRTLCHLIKTNPASTKQTTTMPNEKEVVDKNSPKENMVTIKSLLSAKQNTPVTPVNVLGKVITGIDNELPKTFQKISMLKQQEAIDKLRQHKTANFEEQNSCESLDKNNKSEEQKVADQPPPTHFETETRFVKLRGNNKQTEIQLLTTKYDGTKKIKEDLQQLAKPKTEGNKYNLRQRKSCVATATTSVSTVTERVRPLYLMKTQSNAGFHVEALPSGAIQIIDAPVMSTKPLRPIAPLISSTKPSTITGNIPKLRPISATPVIVNPTIINSQLVSANHKPPLYNLSKSPNLTSGETGYVLGNREMINQPINSIKLPPGLNVGSKVVIENGKIKFGLPLNTVLPVAKCLQQTSTKSPVAYSPNVVPTISSNVLPASSKSLTLSSVPLKPQIVYINPVSFSNFKTMVTTTSTVNGLVGSVRTSKVNTQNLTVGKNLTSFPLAVDKSGKWKFQIANVATNKVVTPTSSVNHFLSFDGKNFIVRNNPIPTTRNIQVAVSTKPDNSTSFASLGQVLGKYYVSSPTSSVALPLNTSAGLTPLFFNQVTKQTTHLTTLPPVKIFNTPSLVTSSSPSLVSNKKLTESSVLPSGLKLLSPHSQKLANGQKVVFVMPMSPSNKKPILLPKSCSDKPALSNLNRPFGLKSNTLSTGLKSNSPSVPIQLGLHEKLFTMTNKKSKNGFLPDCYDEKFLALLGMEKCVDSLQNKYFNISKSAPVVSSLNSFGPLTKKRSRSKVIHRACGIEKIVEVVFSDSDVGNVDDATNVHNEDQNGEEKKQIDAIYNIDVKKEDQIAGKRKLASIKSESKKQRRDFKLSDFLSNQLLYPLIGSSKLNVDDTAKGGKTQKSDHSAITGKTQKIDDTPETEKKQKSNHSAITEKSQNGTSNAGTGEEVEKRLSDPTNKPIELDGIINNGRLNPGSVGTNVGDNNKAISDSFTDPKLLSSSKLNPKVIVKNILPS